MAGRVLVVPHVITITGPSGCGKSTAVECFLKHSSKRFRPKLIPKYTTRPARGDDSGEVVCVPMIPQECDLVYEQYETRYGIEFKQLFDATANGYTPILIINDVRAVEDVRSAFR